VRPVIRVEDLWKCYRIGYDQAKARRRGLGDTIRDVATAPLRHLRQGAALGRTEKFWALKDINFEVKPGEVVGIIGRNGAGKTTLLKILSRITLPTKGHAGLRGRVGSLLEVGTGFHPELTGRENVFLNGAILGMTRREITRKFDEIAEFSGVEQFLDTPVKRYSSGMRVRLAFAVAAHLDPEILLIDEVLAVGDTAFQQKCLGKMGDLSQGGRTIVFVSHNLAAVRSLCQRGIFLENGQIHTNAPVDKALDAYLTTLEAKGATDLVERTDRRGKGDVRLQEIQIFRDFGRASNMLVTGAPAHFIFHLNRIEPNLTCAFTIFDQRGQPVSQFNSRNWGLQASLRGVPQRALCCRIDELLLVPGHYRINVGIRVCGELQDRVEGAAFFNVEQGVVRGQRTPDSGGYGAVFFPHQWSIPT